MIKRFARDDLYKGMESCTIDRAIHEAVCRGRESPSLFSHPDLIAVVVVALLATHAPTKGHNRLRRAEATREAVPIKVAFSAATFAFAKKLVPLGQIGEGDFFRASGWLRIASRYDREGGASAGIGSLYLNWQRSLNVFFVFEHPFPFAS